MSELPANSHETEIPHTLEGQLEMLRAPIVIDDPTRLSYSELDPHNVEATRPTSVTPYSLYILGDDGTGNHITYSGVSTLVVEARMDDAVEVANLDPDDPSQAYARGLQEALNSLAGRMRRNQESFERLMKAVEQGNVPLDDEMFRIIYAARGGSLEPHEKNVPPDLAQFVRLLKEYPEMISVETFKFAKPFDPQAREEAREVIKQQVWDLQREFKDAEVTVYDPWLELKEPYIDENGTRVSKFVAASIRSRDSSSELIVKETDLIVPPLACGDGENSPVRVEKMTIQGAVYEQVGTLPDTILSYLRVTGYEQQPGYEPPEQAKRRLAELAVRSTLTGEESVPMSPEEREQLKLCGHDLAILSELPPEMVESYLLGARSFYENPHRAEDDVAAVARHIDRQD